jgi:hypothetical protein
MRATTASRSVCPRRFRLLGWSTVDGDVVVVDSTDVVSGDRHHRLVGLRSIDSRSRAFDLNACAL